MVDLVVEGVAVLVEVGVVDVVAVVALVGGGPAVVRGTVVTALVDVAAEVATIVDRGGFVDGATFSVDSVAGAVGAMTAVRAGDVLEGAVGVGTVVRSP